MKLVDGLNKILVLDFDGVVTDKKFHILYSKENIQICSANPTITKDYFIKYDLGIPQKINSMKGKFKKLKQLIEISKKYDYMFYIDDEEEYLQFAFIFGIKTYIWQNNKIMKYTMFKGEK